MKKSRSQKSSRNPSCNEPAKLSTASDESNDTFPSRRFLKDSLAQDPWTGNNTNQSRHQLNSTAKPSGAPSNEPERDSPSRNKARSKRALRASMLDVPNVRDSMLANMASNTPSRHAAVKDEKSSQRSDVAHIQRERKNAPAINTKKGERKSAATTKNDAKTKPPTESLSSLGLDASEVGNRSSVFGGYWDANNPHSLDDEESSGAMALVRSIEGDAIRKGAERKQWYCHAVKCNATIIVSCAVFTVVVLLVMFIPHRSNVVALNAIDEHVTLVPTNTTAAIINHTSAQEQLSVAEHVIEVCNPYGYDHDKYECQNLCQDKECCFLNPDDDRGTYCGDEIWHHCIEYSGCQPFFSK